MMIFLGAVFLCANYGICAAAHNWQFSNILGKVVRVYCIGLEVCYAGVMDQLKQGRDEA